MEYGSKTGITFASVFTMVVISLDRFKSVAVFIRFTIGNVWGVDLLRLWNDFRLCLHNGYNFFRPVLVCYVACPL